MNFYTEEKYQSAQGFFTKVLSAFEASSRSCIIKIFKGHNAFFGSEKSRAEPL